MNPPRRVVTGLDSDGRSCVLFDGPSPTVVWETHESPADNSGTADAGGGPLSFPAIGSNFIFNDFQPGGDDVFMHATDTIDYIVVVSGEITLVTETGETLLRAGDVVVDRGVVHGWRNDSGAPCRIMGVALPSRPVGKGATISGQIQT